MLRELTGDLEPSSVDREKAAELRVAADRMFDFATRFELLTTAESYEKLTDFVENAPPPDRKLRAR
jgi:hypothetical protein